MIDTLFAWVETAAALVGWASASAAVLILGAWLMRKALGGKLGPGWRSALGWLVVLRLLCLVAPESRWSWRNWVGHLSLVTGHSSLATQAPVLRTEGPMIRRELEQSASGRSQPVASDSPSLGQTRKEGPSRLFLSHQPLTYEPDVATHEHEAVRLEALTSLGDIVVPRLPARVIPWLGLIWGAGAVVMLGMAVARHFLFWRRVRRFSRPLPAGCAIDCWFEESRELLPVHRRVRLRTLEGLGSPVVFGFFRPFILLPPEVAGPLTAGEARHIFLHELAHIRCGDVLANWLLIAVRALHWFNPLVWIALRQMTADRELLRDAMALRALPGGDLARREYGHTLLRLATTISPPGLAPGLASLLHTQKEIHRRIAMIKSPPDINRPRWPKALAGGVALALATVTFTTARDDTPAAGTSTEARNPTGAPEKVPSPTAETIATPAEVTDSKPVDPTAPLAADATPVVAELEAVVGAADEAKRISQLQRNEKRLTVLDLEIAKMTAEGKKQEVEVLTSLRGELLREIYRAKFLPPAKEVAERASAPQTALEAGRVDLAVTEARKGQEQVVEQARQRMTALVRELGIEEHESILTRLRTIKEVSEYKSQLESIKDKRGEELVGAAASLGIEDPETCAAYTAYLEDKTKLKDLQQKYLDLHPTTVAFKASMKAHKAQLEVGAEKIRTALETKLKTADSALTQMKDLMEKIRTGDYARYQQAENDYRVQQEILQAMVSEEEKARLLLLMEPKKARFTILGAVKRPGAFFLPAGQPLTLLEAIGMAGGFSKAADQAKISIKRAGGAAPLSVNAKKMAK